MELIKNNEQPAPEPSWLDHVPGWLIEVVQILTAILMAIGLDVWMMHYGS